MHIEKELGQFRWDVVKHGRKDKIHENRMVGFRGFEDSKRLTFATRWG